MEAKQCCWVERHKRSQFGSLGESSLTRSQTYRGFLYESSRQSTQPVLVVPAASQDGRQLRRYAVQPRVYTSAAEDPEYQAAPTAKVAYTPEASEVDLKPSATGYGHQAEGYLDMGAYSGNYGAFGWYADYPVGGGYHG